MLRPGKGSERDHGLSMIYIPSLSLFNFLKFWDRVFSQLPRLQWPLNWVRSTCPPLYFGHLRDFSRVLTGSCASLPAILQRLFKSPGLGLIGGFVAFWWYFSSIVLLRKVDGLFVKPCLIIQALAWARRGTQERGNSQIHLSFSLSSLKNKI